MDDISPPPKRRKLNSNYTQESLSPRSLPPSLIAPDASILSVDETCHSNELLESSVSGEANTFCFGMLTDITINTHNPSTAVLPVTPVVLRKRHVILKDEVCTTFGEVEPFVAQALQTVAAQNGVELQSHISRKSRQLLSNSNSKNCPYMLSAIIYGPEDQYEDVGEFLERCELYLQDPKHCDRIVKYKNPQSLIQDIVMTQVEQPEVSQELQPFANGVDFLASFENGGQLPETETPSCIKTELFGHQKQALTFMIRRERGWVFHDASADLWHASTSANGTMYTNTISQESTFERPPEFRGGIIADQMGLGKSLSMIALIASDKDVADSKPRTTLLVVRAALLQTWASQLDLHLHPGQLRWTLHYGKNRMKDAAQLQCVDIVLTTYQSMMVEWKQHQSRPRFLYENFWHRIVLDEAHDIRDSGSSTARAMCALEANSRWAVTGTPIQNRMSDLGSLCKFLRVYPYHDTRQFNDLLCTASNDPDHGVQKLKTFINYIMLRRSICTVELPSRCDIVSKLDFNAEELTLYNSTKIQAHEKLADLSALPMSSATTLNVLALINRLLMICNLGTNASVPNPCNSGYNAAACTKWDTLAAQNAFNSLVVADSALCDSCAADLGSVATEVADQTACQQGQPLLSSCLRLVCGPCLEKTEDLSSCAHVPACPTAYVSTLSSNIPINGHTNDVREDRASTKIQALLQDIRKHATHEKSVVFSFWTTSLDYIEAALDRNGISSIRIDGKVSSKKRAAGLQSFSKDEGVRVALLTISCGAVGLDLTCASRAYLMEPHWNPSVEQQALARIYRMGQTRPVTTIRYIIRDSFEEHVLNVQARKQALTDMLLSTKNHDNKKQHSERIQLFKNCL